MEGLDEASGVAENAVGASEKRRNPVCRRRGRLALRCFIPALRVGQTKLLALHSERRSMMARGAAKEILTCVSL